MINKLPRISTVYSDFISTKYISAVKSWAKENKERLPDYAREQLERLERENNFHFHTVYTIEATYFNTYDNPVLFIVGMVLNCHVTDADHLTEFVEVFTNDNDTAPIVRRYALKE